MYGDNNAFTALLSHLNQHSDTMVTVSYNYPYALTETQAKEISPWFMVRRNEFRIINFD